MRRACCLLLVLVLGGCGPGERHQPMVTPAPMPHHGTSASVHESLNPHS